MATTNKSAVVKAQPSKKNSVVTIQIQMKESGGGGGRGKANATAATAFVDLEKGPEAQAGSGQNTSCVTLCGSLVIALLIFISIALDLVVLKKFPTGPAFALVASMIAFGFFLIFLIVRLIDNNENARAPN
ncbi:hypothetical protein BDA96_03G331800 [Sorghum bicolor]|uniref:Transmembrane protein n=2 Tax=Sorghum bicolor TaxID=4558 RepID=A0A1B6Q6B6_SORBI|nr:hypothetical protein BDA96_03G331800 [Sorghum bicolor]KXG33447.1 hypothetical protein SORBI_3003G307300 [Sorghum bicolor]